KLGCAAWCFTPKYQAPYEKAIETIGRLGFDGVELIVSSKEELQHYYTPTKIGELRSLYSSYNLTLSEFVIYHDVIEELSSFDAEEKARGLEAFEKAVKVANSLGTNIVNMVSPWPLGLKAPVSYVSAYIHPYSLGIRLFDPKMKMNFERQFSWEEVWDNYVDSIKKCLEVVSRYDMRLVIEGHAHVIVSTTDAFLRLCDVIKSPLLGMNFDTSWQLLQREYLPMSIYKLHKHLFHIHVRDGDGLLCYNLPPGLGIIDWEEFIETLRDIGYEGFLSIELGQYKEPEKYIKIAKEYLQTLL
ncbi:MAG: sugar phosphate isomerase/epimerase, partial [Deltaproteobacteria bacterium]